MRYLITARVRPDRAANLLEAIEAGTLGWGSIAGDEYLRDMEQARLVEEGRVRWVEVCFCSTPLAEERPYWEEYFELIKVQDAHDRRRCRDLNGEEPWACSYCDCSERLEATMVGWGQSFLTMLRSTLDQDTDDLWRRGDRGHGDKTSPCPPFTGSFSGVNKT